MRAIAAIVFSMMAFQAAAQDALPPIEEVAKSISGKEVLAEGQIGKLSGDWSFRTSDDIYSVELAVDRETLAAIKDCKLELFPRGNECNAVAKAEISINGPRISLIIYEIILQPEPATDPS
ncbi:hypothetical protein [Paracoccus sp. SSJ]|uniref:hypothetical protein n=1 Tax=Paracoccus sp. SSJ TaxID=3050636 RepID=UPI00254C73B7|nr:hypothetical protein [Paracoccus sp. SSJ]MDK8871489.1 hypothetical protein [Paracoccus sp. SSJ]